MKNSVKLLTILACAGLLAGCGDGASSEKEQSQSVSTSESGGGSSSTSGITPETEYAIIDRTGVGVNLTFSKTKAKKGETVIVNVTLDEGYVLLALYANKVECTKVNDTTYSFAMGDSPVSITASLNAVGDVTLSGDMAAVFAKQEDGSYKANITCENATKLLVNVGSNQYGYGAVDFDLSYADIDSVHVSSSKVTQFELGGNAIYEVTFDLRRGEKPISVYRTGILKAPSNADEIGSYFCGSYAGRNVLDGGAYNVKGLNHVEYRNSRTLVQYSWDLHLDGSIAKAKNISTDKTAFVYKAVKDNVFTVVDEYIESGTDADGNAFDRTKLSDTVKYSGKYAIVDEVSNSHYEKTLFEATRDIETPSHELHSINMGMQYGYSVGYVIEDELKACDRKFDAKKNDDGSFVTTVNSWKNYADSNNAHTRYEYAITININADGTLKSGSYEETYYTESNFNFNDAASNGGSVKPGMEGKTIESSSYSYGYGEPLSTPIDFDTAPYFITSISNLKVKSNKDKTKEEGHVKFKEVLDEARRDPNTKSIDDDSVGYTTTLHFDYAPITALDSWEYGIVASNDSSIVGKNVSRPLEWTANAPGTTEITIGNHSTNDVTIKTNVTVDEAPSPKGYYVWAYGNETEDDVPTSTSVTMKAGRRMNVYLWGSPADCAIRPELSCSNSNIKLTLSDGMVVPTVSTIASFPAYVLTIDASAVSTDTKLTETIIVKDKGDPTLESEITLTINPGTPSLLPSSLVGTSWTAYDFVTKDGVKDTDPRYMEGTFVAAKLAFSDEDGKTINGLTYKKGTLTISGTTYHFYYRYGVGDSGSMLLSLASAEMTKSGSSGDSLTMTDFEIGGATLEDYGLLGIYACESTYSGAGETETNYLVGYPEEEDGPAEYEWFTLDA